MPIIPGSATNHPAVEFGDQHRGRARPCLAVAGREADAWVLDIRPHRLAIRAPGQAGDFAAARADQKTPHLATAGVHIGPFQAIHRRGTGAVGGDASVDQHLGLAGKAVLSALPQAALTTAVVACQQAREQLLANGPRASLLDCLQRWLLRHVREAPSLERAAAAFAMSPATFKRKLHKHTTSYQQQHDQVRLQVALYLYQVKGYSNDQVASHLHFHDATNFRRSFKRWTGVPPSALRRWLTGEV